MKPEIGLAAAGEAYGSFDSGIILMRDKLRQASAS